MTEMSLKSYLVSRDHNYSTVVKEYKVAVEVVSFWEKNTFEYSSSWSLMYCRHYGRG